MTPSDRRRLLTWFSRHQRSLPWRENRDAYRIWVSEVMLQQTTVATVGPRFEAFMKQFPTLESLANSDEQEVLKAWEGLGYYSRARNLRKAAGILFEQYGETIPDDPEIWAELPGVGPYIMGAVLSQAFDRRLPIVEANTRRVLARLGAKRDKLTAPEMQRWLWQTATEILPAKKVGDFNQAMMELGASLCTPKQPDCPACPLRQCCDGFKAGIQEELPTLDKPAAIQKINESCAVIRFGDRLLLRKRPNTGRWAGMWEFPTREYSPPENHTTSVIKLLDEIGFRATPGGILMTIPYTVMRFRVTMTCLEVILPEKPTIKQYDEMINWVSLADLAEYPIRSSQRKLANRLTGPIQREMF